MPTTSITKIKTKHKDATHNVFAYVLGDGTIQRYSDDGEPQGTAGMPVLDAIRKNELFDVTVVVVRYFGGTLLGTGGLVRAYTEAALGAIREGEIVVYDNYKYFMLSLSYSEYQKFIPFAEGQEVRIEDTEFSSHVTVKGSIKSICYERFAAAFTDFTGGKSEIIVLEEKFSY